MHIREIMTTSVHTCRAYESLNAAAQKMWEADVGAVPVLDDKDRVVGMLTDRDICMATYTQGRPLSELIAAEIMSHTVVSCAATDTVARAEDLMRTHRIRRLPVVDGGRRLVGIVSMNDLVRTVAKTRQGQNELVATLAAIGEPRQAVDQTAWGEPRRTGT